MKLGDLDFKTGKVNPSGIVPMAYRIKREAITAWPTIVDEPVADSTIGTVSNYVGDFVLAATEKWERIYCTQGKGKASFEPVGENDVTMYMNKGVLVYPDISDEARAFAKEGANGAYVYLFHTPGNPGRYHVIGNKDYRTTTKCSGDTGDAPGSAKGLTINVECADITPLPCYKGDLLLSNGSMDCATGIFTPAAG